MYTQEVVCPRCSKSTKVNVLEKQGKTETACQHCHTTIVVVTDKDGKVEKLHTSCIIATACISVREGQESDSQELAALRNFRDTYIRRQGFGSALLADYYSVAPIIVARINAQESSNKIFSEIYDRYLVQAVALIEQGKNIDALNLYYEFIGDLKKKYLTST